MTFNIPTIDIAPFLTDPSSEEAAKVVADVRTACMTTGFFSLVGHNVARELQQRLLGACEKLFALPLETKKALRPPTGSPLLNRGYELIGGQVLQEGALPDLKEGYFIGQDIPYDDPRVQKHPLLMGANIFPGAAENFDEATLREPAEEYYKAVLQLARTVLEILARGLPYGDDVFAEFMSNDPLCNLRLLHYPPQRSEDARQLGAGAHTDFGAVTLLYQDGSGGLEVLDAATDNWVPVAPNPDAYVVNVGDMLSLWTKNVYKSNVHRVINRGTSDRYSVPFFFDGNLDTKLAPFDGSSPLDGGAVLTAEQHVLNRLGKSHSLAEEAATAA